MALSPVLWPIAVAGVLAILLDPVVDWLASRKVPRLRAILLVFGGAAFLFLGVIGSVIPRAVVEARDLAVRVPHYVEEGQRRIENLINHPPAPIISLLPQTWQAEWRARVTGAFAEGRPIHQPHPGQAARRASAWRPTRLRRARSNRSPPERRPGPASTTPASASGPVGAGGVQGGSPWWARALDPRALKTAGGWLGTIAAEAGGWVVGQFGRLASWIGVLAGLALIPVTPSISYWSAVRSRSGGRTTSRCRIRDSRTNWCGCSGTSTTR